MPIFLSRCGEQCYADKRGVFSASNDLFPGGTFHFGRETVLPTAVPRLHGTKSIGQINGNRVHLTDGLSGSADPSAFAFLTAVRYCFNDSIE